LIVSETEPIDRHKLAAATPRRSLATSKRAAHALNQLQHTRAYALLYVTSVAILDETPAYSMGRAGIEPATLGLKVRLYKLQQTA